MAKDKFDFSELTKPYDLRPQTENNFNVYLCSPDYINFTNKFWDACKKSMQIGN